MIEHSAQKGALGKVKRIGQTRIEWVLLSIIALVCSVLSFLQYRWTGELSRAEPAYLRAGLNEQVRRLVQDFDGELRESCTALLPEAKEIREQGFLSAHRFRYEQWSASHNRSLFSQIAIAKPEQGELKLYEISANGQILPIGWPTNWELFRVAMTARMKRIGRPPNTPRDSIVIELPIFGEPNQTGPELEWMIFEPDQAEIRTKVLPPLVAEYLNPGSEATYDVSVSWAVPGHPVVFSTSNSASNRNADIALGADTTAGIFPMDIGSVPALRRNRRDNSRDLSRWTIAVRHRAGSLNAAVSRVRTRNLTASLILVALLGSTAWALVHYTARSRRLSEMQFRFAAGVSHDLRTPLTAIRGAAFNLVEGVVHEPEAVRRYLKLILRNAGELTSMIENVLAFSASLNAGNEQRHEGVFLDELIRQATMAMTPEIEQAGCHIEVNVAPDLPAVAGDPVAIELVFRNLIGNAVRHGAGGKWVGISAALSGDGVEVRVCDHGPGVPEVEQKRIFEPFFRGEQTRAQRIPGTGLGLSLVKNTIERYQGTVQVHNSPDGGAQFMVRLPVVPDSV